MEKHSHCSAKRRDLRLQIDDSVGGFLVHGAVIRAKLRPRQPLSLQVHRIWRG
jgi:hypothetical protein